MHVGPSLGERRVWVGVRDILALEQRNVTVGAVNVFLYMSNPKQWVMSASVLREVWAGRVYTYSAFLFLPPLCRFW